MKVKPGLLTSIIIVTLPLVLLFSSLQVFIFRQAYYNLQFSRHNIEEATGMEMQDLLYTMDEVLRYLQGNREDLVVVSYVNGQEREIFGQRAKEHMVDVQGLFQAGFFIRNVSLAFLLPALLFLAFKKKKRALAKTLAWASCLPILAGCVLLAIMALNFSRAFVVFHEIFFSNDLWILDPRREILIQMVPQGFFMDTALLAATIFITANLAIGIASLIYLRRAQRLDLDPE